MEQSNFTYTSLYHKLAEQLEENHSAIAMVTLIEKKGSCPQQTGAKMLISQGQEKPLLGTIGGGSLEAYAINFVTQQFACQGQAVSHNPLPQIIKLNLQRDLNMHCGGEVKLLFEFFMPQNPWNIVVFGAGHISQALVPLLCQLNASIYCLDDRAEWLDAIQEASNLKKIHLEDWKNPTPFLAEINKPDEAFYISLSRTHRIDFDISKELYLTGIPAYVGVIGSKTKARKLTMQLKEAGISDKKLTTLHCPIGSNLSNAAPFEIAISICAQLLEKR